MSTRRSILLGTAVVAVGVLWYLFRPDALVISKTVSEPFPDEGHSMSAMAPSMARSTPAMAEPGTMAPPAMAAAAEEPMTVTSGRFHTNAHETKGVATIYRLEDGRRVLRLTEFATSNGPDVRVYLVAAGDVQDEAAAKRAGFVDLGALKGNVGDQNYDVPDGVDLVRYRAVSIWCRRFSVNFGAAPLSQIPS
jgi:Electron transfer DM13